jgi:hypothetical protein
VRRAVSEHVGRLGLRRWKRRHRCDRWNGRCRRDDQHGWHRYWRCQRQRYRRYQRHRRWATVHVRWADLRRRNVISGRRRLQHLHLHERFDWLHIDWLPAARRLRLVERGVSRCPDPSQDVPTGCGFSVSEARGVRASMWLPYLRERSGGNQPARSDLARVERPGLRRRHRLWRVCTGSDWCGLQRRTLRRHSSRVTAPRSTELALRVRTTTGRGYGALG